MIINRDKQTMGDHRGTHPIAEKYSTMKSQILKGIRGSYANAEFFPGPAPVQREPTEAQHSLDKGQNLHKFLHDYGEILIWADKRRSEKGCAPYNG